MRFTELPLSAQTAYAELLEQSRTLELTNALAGLVGSFHKLTRKGRVYWYFAYRDLGQKVRMAYVGPNDERVRALVERFGRVRRAKPLAPMAQVARSVAGKVARYIRAPRRKRVLRGAASTRRPRRYRSRRSCRCRAWRSMRRTHRVDESCGFGNMPI